MDSEIITENYFVQGTSFQTIPLVKIPIFLLSQIANV